MNVAVLVTLGTSLTLYMAVLLVTKSSLLASITFAIPALLNLSLWLVWTVTGVGPGNFIPHWIAALLTLVSVVCALFWRWSTDFPYDT